MKNENVNLPEFGIKVLSNWGRCTLTYLLANIGILMVVGAFVALILDGEDIDVLVGTFTAEVKNKKLTLTDKDGEVLTLERGSSYF